jgi:hypothetical protein
MLTSMFDYRNATLKSAREYAIFADLDQLRIGILTGMFAGRWHIETGRMAACFMKE